MNCKPGDLAIIIKDAITAKTAGMIVTVLYAAPTDREFTLPDGFGHNRSMPNQWIVQFSSPVKVWADYARQRTRLALYASVADRYLRPLPGINPLEEEQEHCPVSES